MEFKERLRKLRSEQGMTQEELAEKLGLTKPAISAYERGQNKPRFDTIDDLADIFDVDINYLLGNSDERKPYPRHYIQPTFFQAEAPQAHDHETLIHWSTESNRVGFAEDSEPFSKKVAEQKNESSYKQVEVTAQEYDLIMALRVMSPSKRDAVYAEILK